MTPLARDAIIASPYSISVLPSRMSTFLNEPLNGSLNHWWRQCCLLRHTAIDLDAYGLQLRFYTLRGLLSLSFSRSPRDLF